MAEIELAGAKIRGGRLLLVIPIVSALAGGLWGAFEFYKDYSIMKDKIETYVAPDMSGFDKNLAVLDEDMILVKEEFKLYKEMITDLKSTIGDMKSDVHDIRIELRDDITGVHTNLEQQDTRNRSNVETVRGVINAFEVRMDRKIDKLDDKLDSLEENLDLKIKKALENPLSKAAGG